ncbi:BTB domain-containing protein [Caenorhabditis elegans]|uniref:BTB domain-containing protein n=1 Tax=Caenorhabditis elegans TaxID=6239 RepID=Q9TYI9_CAEEL|nr:BTB domain-containing protein [Caenorhabditis elegans]CCD69497.1 BTB domain-containing protein [Caenorhabditis elegans]|eukprot:NP_494525.1 Uncharacterized protein CELE_Y49F6C.2 [Caenorhabditis elegans]
MPNDFKTKIKKPLLKITCNFLKLLIFAYKILQIQHFRFKFRLSIVHFGPLFSFERIFEKCWLISKIVLTVRDMPFAIRKCEEFLVEKYERPKRDILNIAKQYQLENLKKLCLAKINTIDEIKAAMAGNLSDMEPTVLAALLEKSVALK